MEMISSSRFVKIPRSAQMMQQHPVQLLGVFDRTHTDVVTSVQQDDDASDEEEDALESLIQHELSKFQQQQAVKYAELAASGWVALPLPSPAPVQQLLRAEEHQLETEPSGKPLFLHFYRPCTVLACSNTMYRWGTQPQRPVVHAVSWHEDCVIVCHLPHPRFYSTVQCCLIDV
jgi:hypothetical protein